MKTTKYQNTLFFKGIKYYNDIIFGNIIKKKKKKYKSIEKSFEIVFH